MLWTIEIEKRNSKSMFMHILTLLSRGKIEKFDRCSHSRRSLLKMLRWEWLYMKDASRN